MRVRPCSGIARSNWSTICSVDKKSSTSFFKRLIFPARICLLRLVSNTDIFCGKPNQCGHVWAWLWGTRLQCRRSSIRFRSIVSKAWFPPARICCLSCWRRCCVSFRQQFLLYHHSIVRRLLSPLWCTHACMHPFHTQWPRMNVQYAHRLLEYGCNFLTANHECGGIVGF